MMFVLFFVWGAWFAGLGRFMLEAGMADSLGNAYACTPIAAIITPFFIGVFADRFINAEKLQGLLLLLSGVFIAIAPSYANHRRRHYLRQSAPRSRALFHADSEPLQHHLPETRRGRRN